MQCSRLLYPFAWLPRRAKHHGQKVTRLSDFENTTIGGPVSSHFDEFLAGRSKFDSVHGVDCYAPTYCQSATFVRPLFVFYSPLFFTKNNNK